MKRNPFKNNLIAATAIFALAAGMSACGSGTDDALAASGSEQSETTTTAAATTTTAEATTTTQATTTTTEATTTTAPSYDGFTQEDALVVGDRLSEAFNTYDVEAFKAVVASDYLFVDERGTETAAGQIGFFPALREARHTGTGTSDPVVSGDGPFIVTTDFEVTATFYPVKRVGVSTLTVVAENGELRVKEFRWTGDRL